MMNQAGGRMAKRVIENVEIDAEDVPDLKRPVTYSQTVKKRIPLKEPHELHHKKLKFNIDYSNGVYWKPNEVILNVKIRKGYMDVNEVFQRGHNPSQARHGLAECAEIALDAATLQPHVPQQDERDATPAVRWTNGLGFKLVKSIKVQPDGQNNMEETPTDTRESWKNWNTYLHMYTDKSERENKVMEDAYLVDHKVLKHENPNLCGISLERGAYRTGDNAADVQAAEPLTDEELEMIAFEERQYWREDGDGWMNLRIPLPGHFFTSNAQLSGLMNYHINIELNSDSFCLVSRFASRHGNGAAFESTYQINAEGTFLELCHYSRDEGEMLAFEKEFFDASRPQTYFTEFKPNCWFTEAFIPDRKSVV